MNWSICWTNLHNCSLNANVLILWNYLFHIFRVRARAHQPKNANKNGEIVDPMSSNCIADPKRMHSTATEIDCDRIMLINLSIVLYRCHFIRKRSPDASSPINDVLFVSMASFDIYWPSSYQFYRKRISSTRSFHYQHHFYSKFTPVSTHILLMQKRKHKMGYWIATKCEWTGKVAFFCSAESKLPFFICRLRLFHSKTILLLPLPLPYCVCIHFGFICLDLNAFSFVSVCSQHIGHTMLSPHQIYTIKPSEQPKEKRNLICCSGHLVGWNRHNKYHRIYSERSGRIG